jgi:hypothetical protein
MKCGVCGMELDKEACISSDKCSVCGKKLTEKKTK